MRRRLHRVGAIVLTLAVPWALVVANAEPLRAEDAIDHAISGDVTVVDPIANTFTVRDDDGQLTTLVVDDDTARWKDDESIGLADLAKGDRVAVEWNDWSGRNRVTYLEVVEDPGSAGNTAAASPPTVSAR